MSTLLRRSGLIILGMALAGAACNTASNTATNVNIKTTAANATPLPTQSPSASTAATADNFWNEAAVGGMAEVELGKVASANAQSAEVKQFGQMMVTDHGKANSELKDLAAKNNVTLPMALDAKHQATLDRLKGLKGAEFDRAYVDEMLEDHEEDVKAFEKQSESATNADLKAFAAKTLPTLRKHLDAIKTIDGKLK